jgi:cobalt-precorrin-5B (C1)-methyltransferase
MSTQMTDALLSRAKRGNRTGWSTGATAAGAAAAATHALETGEIPREIEIHLPENRVACLPVADCAFTTRGAHATVIKDAGDDPDATNGARIIVEVEPLPLVPGVDPGVIRIDGGPGVGRVTRAGLGLPVGEAAINPNPRRYIAANVRAAAPTLLAAGGLLVTVSVVDGEQLARRTLNARLGILGGISILGTTGVVYPYSTASFKATVIQGVRVAVAQGQRTVCFTTGRRTELYCMAAHLELPEVCFVQMGDFVGAALDAARAARIDRVVVGAMAGKLTKIAQGLRITHARKAPVDMQLLARLAAASGADADLCRKILEGNTARWAAELIADAGLTGRFHQALTQAAAQAVADQLPAGIEVEMLAWGPEGEPLGHAEICRREAHAP